MNYVPCGGYGESRGQSRRSCSRQSADRPRFGALADHAPLLLGESRIDVEHEGVGISPAGWEIACTLTIRMEGKTLG